MWSALAKRLIQQAPRGQRGMAGHGYAPVPKPDTSMDHVFGDNSYRVNFDFQPPSTMTTFSLTVATIAFFGFPAWMMVYEENKVLNLKAQIAAARAANLEKESS